MAEEINREQNIATLAQADKKATIAALLKAYNAKFHPAALPAWNQAEHNRFLLFAFNRFIELPADKAPLFDLLATNGLGGNASQFAQHYAESKNGGLIAPRAKGGSALALDL